MPATASSLPSSSSSSQPATMADYDPREDSAWIYSFGAAMVPFCGFLYIHKLGMTARVVEATVRSPIGVYGLFLLPFCTLAMEKSIYDTVQSWQGINPQVRPADRGGFPSGGAALPSFSWIPVQPRAMPRLQTFVSKSTPPLPLQRNDE